MLWLITLVILILIYWLYLQWKHRRMFQLSSSVPGPFAWPIIGNSLIFLSSSTDQLDLLTKLINKYGDYTKFWLGPGDLNICVKNPNDIRLLLTSNKLNQKGPDYRFLREFIGAGILTGGPTWRLYRKIVTPTYNRKSVKNFVTIFNREADVLAKTLAGKDPDKIINVYKDVVKITTQCVCQTLMGLSKDESENLRRLDEVIYITPKVYKLIHHKITRWWLQIPFISWLVGRSKIAKEYHSATMELASDIIEKRRQSMRMQGVSDEESLGIVDRFILSGELSEEDLRNETFCLFTSSQEASAKIASGVLLFLAHLPEWQDKVHKEISEVVGSEDIVTMDHLKKLRYLDMVFKETLRYFAIAAFIQRTVVEEISINNGKITLPVGTSVIIPIHDLHRDPRFWEDPYKVMPERFLQENARKLVNNAFVPFSLGPMDCLGRVYGTALIKILVVKVLKNIKLDGGMSLDDIKLDVAISVRSATGYNVKVSPRKIDLSVGLGMEREARSL